MTSPRPAASGPRSDGRTRRTRRSREAMVDALYALVGEGVLRPTAHQVAERAGVGIRTVFRHFSDMDTLFAELHARLRREVAPLLRDRHVEGTPEERARGLARQRVAVFEHIAPFVRSASLLRARSPYLQREHGALVAELRASVERWLPELAAGPPGVADAVELVASFEAWERLRREQGLGVRRAGEVLESTLATLVAGLGATTPGAALSR